MRRSLILLVLIVSGCSGSPEKNVVEETVTERPVEKKAFPLPVTPVPAEQFGRSAPSMTFPPQAPSMTFPQNSAGSKYYPSAPVPRHRSMLRRRLRHLQPPAPRPR